MIKCFKKYNPGTSCFQAVTVDLQTGEMLLFNYSTFQVAEIDYIIRWGEFYTDTKKMGYDKPKDYLRRAKELGMNEFDIDTLNGYTTWNPVLSDFDLTEVV